MWWPKNVTRAAVFVRASQGDPALNERRKRLDASADRSVDVLSEAK